MMTEQTIHFMSDKYRLTGTLHLPEASHPPFVIGCHGLFANRNSPKQIDLANACVRSGIAYLRFDHRGCGDSQGEFIRETSLQARCRDLHHAVELMRSRPDTGPLACLFGSSFGGTVVLAHAAEHPAPLLITYAAPVNSTDIRHDAIRDNNGRPPASAMLTDALEFDIVPQLKAIKNILIAHSQGDETVPVEHAHIIHRNAGTPKNLVIFKGGDHRMSDPTHQQEFEGHFLDWLQP